MYCRLGTTNDPQTICLNFIIISGCSITTYSFSHGTNTVIILKNVIAVPHISVWTAHCPKMQCIVQIRQERDRIRQYILYAYKVLRRRCLLFSQIFKFSSEIFRLEGSRIMFRSSRPEVFCKKDVLRSFTKFTGEVQYNRSYH